MFWKFIAKIVSRPAVAQWLYRHSTPYFDLRDEDGSLYMHRVWLFNPTPPLNNGRGRRWEWLPSVRMHHIMRPDNERHPHNHPWPARTIILKGWYVEERDTGRFFREAGDTATLDAGEFHRIVRVSKGGVWTLFITWRWQHVWGFRTDDGFVPWREYLGIGEGENG